MTEFVVEVPVGIKPGDRFTAGVGTGMKVNIVCPKGAVPGEPLNIKLNPDGGDAIILDPSKFNIFTAVCPKNKRPGDHFDVTDPTGTRMRVIVPHGIKPGQRFSVRGRGTAKKKTGLSASKAPAFAVHFETQQLGALSSKSKMGFSWRFVYTRARKMREHSLFVKFSRNSRQLRVWMNGKRAVDSVIADNMQVVHRIQLNHEGHKLLVKLLFNEPQVEAQLSIDGLDFGSLPQPDQLTSRQVCIPSAIAIRTSKESVGKIFSSSKQRHTWEFKFPHTADRHVLVLTWSQKNVKLYLNRSQIYAKSQTSVFRSGVVFEHIFPFRGIEFRISILRDETEGGTGETDIVLHIGGLEFKTLPRSQQEFNLKHSKELVEQLHRKRRESGIMGDEEAMATAAKGKRSSRVSSKDVEKLSHMGFSKKAARSALSRSSGDFHGALDMLVAEKDKSKKKGGNGDDLERLFDEVAFDESDKGEKFPVGEGNASPKEKQTTTDALMDLFSTDAPPKTSGVGGTDGGAIDPFADLAAGIIGGGSVGGNDEIDEGNKKAVSSSTAFAPPTFKSPDKAQSKDPFADLF